MKEEIVYQTTNKFNREVINEILIVEKNKGLTPENLLEQAKEKNNILHNLFEWDNKIAGENYRLQQARLIINEIKILVNNKIMYAFENVTVNIDNCDKNLNENSTEKVYKPIIEIINTEDLRKQIISKAFEQIQYWKEKYSQFSELETIFISIEKAKKQWEKLKQ